MKRSFLELMSWELRDNWSFPILEIAIAITVLQAMSFSTFTHRDGVDPEVWIHFFEGTLFVLVISVAMVFGRSFGESIEKRKLIVLLSYPVSRARLFFAKYLTNFLMLFSIFGSSLLAQGTSLFLFDGVVRSMSWSYAFLYLLLEVFFVSSVMTLFALLTKRFGLSILIFLVFMFGIQYWIPRNYTGEDPISYLSIDFACPFSVTYLEARFVNWLGLNGGTQVMMSIPDICFLAGLTYMLGGGLVLFLASLVIMKRMDLD